jgi:hypothetical protein
MAGRAEARSKKPGTEEQDPGTRVIMLECSIVRLSNRILGSGLSFYAKSLAAGFQLPLGFDKWGHGNPESFSSFMLLGAG